MNNSKKTEVDALLATTCSRLLNAAAMVNRMRDMHANDCEEMYWWQANRLGEELSVAGHALTEAHRILLADMGISIPREGGTIN